MKISFPEFYTRHFYIIKRTDIRTHECNAEIEVCILCIFLDLHPGLVICRRNAWTFMLARTEVELLLWKRPNEFYLLNATMMTAALVGWLGEISPERNSNKLYSFHFLWFIGSKMWFNRTGAQKAHGSLSTPGIWPFDMYKYGVAILEKCEGP